jgi:hypothetical protein
MPEVVTPRPEDGAATSPNGHAEDPFEAKLLADLDGAIREKRDRVIALEAERDRVSEQLAEAKAASKRFEDMRKRLIGEPLSQGGRKKAATTSPSSGNSTRISPERLEAVRGDILRFVEANGDEFAQVEIRSMPDATITNSGAIAAAFEMLRQEGFIRLARRDGLKKVYRLTRSASAGEQ